MVAITVILAAVIAAFVLDIGPGQGTVTGTAEVVEVDDGDDNVVIDITSASDADHIVVIDSEGESIAESKSANTGAEVTFDHDGTSGEYGVYLINGEISDSDRTLDEAEASTQVDSFEV